MSTTLPLTSGCGLRGLLELSHQEFLTWLAERGEKPMRAKQIRRWLFSGRAESFEEMTDLPLGLRQALAESLIPFASTVVRHSQADDGTHKLLLQLADRSLVECVLIQEDQRRTACISTQVGCGMGCVFCASGLAGFERNLTTGEILEQLLRLQRVKSREARDESKKKNSQDPLPALDSRLSTLDSRLTHIVVMGMGEPLANFDALLAALEMATAKDGLGLSARHITISTVGLPARIRRLAELGKQYHLAVSLHAPKDALRSQIVPTNEQTGLEAILAAADYFFTQTGRQVTYEYVLLAGINDGVSHARELAALLQGRRAHVNVIPFNDVEGLPYRRPTPESQAAFLTILKKQGISVKIRKRKGSRIDAACGQLRLSALGNKG